MEESNGVAEINTNGRERYRPSRKYEINPKMNGIPRRPHISKALAFIASILFHKALLLDKSEYAKESITRIAQSTVDNLLSIICSFNGDGDHLTVSWSGASTLLATFLFQNSIPSS